MTRVAVFSGTRAEYGLLYWLLQELKSRPEFELALIVGGMHLSPEFGETWREIERDGFEIDAKVEMLLSSDTPVGVAKSMGLGVIGLADALDRLRPDLLVVLGDRFEALAVAQAALILRIPIAHLHGGEITEGAYDDPIRHAITKLADVHFAAAEPYRRRVIQMGEPPERVFNVGALGLDHMRRSERLSLAELGDSLGFPLRAPYAVVTYHPVTRADEDPVGTYQALLQALDERRDLQLILTYPNADDGGRAIIPLLEEFARGRRDRVVALPSLGFKRYLSAVAGAAVVIGNSSSGIIEVPAFKVPTVNVGARQRGRLAAASVIHCEPDLASIRGALARALSAEFRSYCRDVHNPYGQGDAATAIADTLATLDFSQTKRFHDIG